MRLPAGCQFGCAREEGRRRDLASQLQASDDPPRGCLLQIEIEQRGIVAGLTGDRRFQAMRLGIVVINRVGHADLGRASAWRAQRPGYKANTIPPLF